MENINFFVVFIEGLLSFLSPCILPILPIYLSILSNSSVDNLKEGKDKFSYSLLFKNTILFVLGISTTFFILGTSVNVISSFFSHNKDLIMLIGGVIIVIMGMFYVDIIKSTFLSKEKRLKMKVKEMNPLSAFLLGFTFSFAWTPCIGPILASVLIISSSSTNVFSGNLLILAYTIGFILPFLIVSAFYNKLYKSIDKMKKHMGLIKKICGVILIVSGLFMVVNGATTFSNRINSSNNETKQEENINNGSSSSENNGNINNEEENKVKIRDFTLQDQYGNEHILSQYEGKTIFLNFWATWCGPCRGEMPHIEEIYKEYGENNEEVVILGVAAPNLGREGSAEDITNFLNENNYTFPVVFDIGGEVSYKYGISAFPTTFIIDKEGYVTLYVPGAMDKETMEKLINTEGKI